MPNLYTYFVKNITALGGTLKFQNRVSTLKSREREVINLVTSQSHGFCCCQSAHTVSGKMNGFSDEQVLEIREGSAFLTVN